MNGPEKAGAECAACKTYAYYCSESRERDGVPRCSGCTHRIGATRD